uniref:G_PROTEIN_RECEP_F1_2 domain-containing protein n=1 Tax=Angiostrongylus cantonensis TaxID=6313 RepID=A0A0K0CUB7_ANGCA
MVSPALEAMSPTNSLIRRIRRADAISRFRARHDGYAWLFGQIHVKGAVVGGGCNTDVKSIAIPMAHQAFHISTSPVSANCSLMGFMVLSAMHGTWQRGVLASLFRINLAFFLIPLLFCVVTLGAGFLLCCIRSFRMQLHQISESRTDQAVTFLIIDSIRFTFLPCALMWIVYLYYVYGCVLSFLYVYRHSWDWSSLKRDIAATSTTSWSFKGGSVTTERKACDEEVITHHLVTCCLEIGRYPSTDTAFQVLFAVLVFSGIVVTTWSLQKLNISSISFILAVLSVIILALFIVAEIVLHIATVIYICRRYDFKRTMNVQDIDFAVKSEVNDTLTATLPAKLKVSQSARQIMPLCILRLCPAQIALTFPTMTFFKAYSGPTIQIG